MRGSDLVAVLLDIHHRNVYKLVFFLLVHQKSFQFVQFGPSELFPAVSHFSSESSDAQFLEKHLNQQLWPKSLNNLTQASVPTFANWERIFKKPPFSVVKVITQCDKKHEKGVFAELQHSHVCWV